jgi:hypothetical protein
MSIYFIYREFSSVRRELVGRADTERQAFSLAIAHSRRHGGIFAVNACTPETLKSRLVACFQGGAALRGAAHSTGGNHDQSPPTR